MDSRRALILRIGMASLAFESVVIGVHALFFPKFFYSNFLLGRAWVQMLPPYNEHLTRDLGALYLGFFVLLAWAAVRLTRDLFNAALGSFVVATIPHMIFHLLHTEDAPLLADKILQSGLLALSAIVSLALMWYGRASAVPADSRR